MRTYLYIVAVGLTTLLLVGLVLPFLFSAKSTEAVLLGVVVAVASPIGPALLAKRLFLTTTRKEEEK